MTIAGFALLAVFISSCGPTKENNLKNWAIAPFIRPAGVNPVLIPLNTEFYCPMQQGVIRWEESDVFNPAAIVKNDTICVLYRAEDNSGQGIGKRTSRIGYAQSVDGTKIVKRRSAPVLFPDEDSQKEMEWPGGCEDPRVAVTEDGTYVILYTQWNRKIARLAVATSKDLVNWEKHGPVFQQAFDGKYADYFSKSASIVTEVKDGRLVISKINGKYMMYWGERHVFAATSTDLVNWTPLVDEKLGLVPLASPRKGYFDSDLTECGPPAVLTKNGIVLIYNGKNKGGDDRDPNYTANSYCAGQMLFDKNDPYKLIDRLDTPFLIPEEDFEKSGQYPAGTVFVEGLVYHRNKWFLYYGCADSRVAVVTCDKKID
ncbi:MAG: glycoside hydrolase family 130 protein [Bacteroidales bacterium]|nr:glycoside hydrolase family 130 protein [Bacteroidales bacterium]